MTSPDIARIRRFNRRYTTQLGLFARDYVGEGLSVSDLRIFFEIIENPEQTARQLSQNLDIDEAQTSRTVKRYIEMGWLERKRSSTDARRKDIIVTAKGRERYDVLDQRASQKTQERLQGVNTSRLADTMDELLLMLGHLPQPDIDIRHLGFGDAGWIAQRHSETYASDPGFTPDFEPFVFTIVADFIAHNDPTRERAFIAWRGSRRLGSIICTGSHDPDIAKLRLFFVEPDARGCGLGKRLLTDCLTFAQDAGYKRMTLTTHESQTLAREMYARAGFRRTTSRPGHLFGCDAVEEIWDLDL